ncbi:MAG: hypothetical protein ACFBZ8_10100 [Opitutales bacterium]
MSALFNPILKRPWIWPVILFLGLVLAWVFLIQFALERQPDEVSLGQSLDVPEHSGDATLPPTAP